MNQSHLLDMQTNTAELKQHQTLKEILNDPANKAAGRVHEAITEGKDVDPEDAENASLCVAKRDGKKRRTYQKEILLKSAIKYKNLSAFEVLLDAGHEDEQALKSVFQKVFDPFQNWVSGHSLIRVNGERNEVENPKGHDIDELSEEWVIAIEKRFPGFMQEVCDGVGVEFKGYRGAAAMEQLKELGVVFNHTHTNNLISYLTRCSIKVQELEEEYGPCLRWLLSEGHIPRVEQFGDTPLFSRDRFFANEHRYSLEEGSVAHRNALAAGVLDEIRALEEGTSELL